VILAHSLDEIASCLLRGSAATWGNFDGVHLGHQALLGCLTAKARSLGLPAAVITFDPHPLDFFSPGSAPRALTCTADKLAMLARLGVDYALVLPFNASFAGQSPEEFARETLVRSLRVKALVLGHDLGFGRRREGGFELLRRLGADYGFSVERAPTVGAPSGCEVPGPVSSTAVREAIRAGALEQAAAMLGRRHSVCGAVQRGAGRGGPLLGFPTANIDPGPLLLPPRGVYACLAKTDTALCPAAANLGLNPSFDHGREVLEAHLLDFAGDLYDKELRLYFLRFLRPERKFASPEELKRQIALDAAEARRIAGEAIADKNFAVLFPL
jgi:riboflavin kinase/FMN adenylyltransferase